MRFFYLLTLISIALSGVYELGDEVSIEHQNLAYDVCYGDYDNDQLRLSDFNGRLNGGDFKVTVFRIAYTW